MSGKGRDVVSLRGTTRGVALLTGINGFLGSHLAVALLRHGYRLRGLCRSRGDVTAIDRMRRTLRWHGIELDERLEVIDGDVSKPNFGLPAAQFAALAETTTELIHCASSTSFAEKHRTMIEETNIQGARTCLQLAQLGRVAHLHHISTAYVAGAAVARCPEALVRPPRFHNPYESSKNEAEHLLAEGCEAAGIGWTIYRPSVIIGDSERGRTLLFNAMYFPVRFFEHMQTVVRRDYGTASGESARKLQTSVAEDGKVVMPLRVNKGAVGGGLINIVPIDYVVDAFMAIYHSQSCHGVFNIVNEHPSKLETLLAHIERYYDITGLRAVAADEYASTSPSQMETAFAAFAEIYLPYISDERVFASDRVRQALGEARACPKIDYEMFARCIDYARLCKWRSPLQTVDMSRPGVVAVA